MKVFLNGEAMDAPDGVTVAGFLALLEMPQTGVAVERNREIVPKSLYATTRLEAGDRLEIVQFVGGGRWGYAACTTRREPSWQSSMLLTPSMAGARCGSREIS
jgi:sulfur carrier protein